MSIRRGRRLGAGLVAVLLSSSLVSTATLIKTSAAGFSGTTSNGVNSWETGRVSLTDNDAGVAMFSTAGSTRSNGVTGTADGLLNQGAVLSRCIQVQYTGTIVGDTNMNVKLYGALGTATALAPGLDVKIQQADTNPVNCTDADWGATGASTVIYDSGVGTTAGQNQLDDFTTAKNSFANGIGTWNAPTANQTKFYRFVITVNTAATQEAIAQATFTWGVQ